jgi:hypothetical protein
MSLRKKGEFLGVDPGTVKNQTYQLENIQEHRLTTFTYKDKDSKAKENCITGSEASSKRVRVSWEERDAFLYEEVVKAVEVLRSLPEPQRISIASIQRLISEGKFTIKLYSKANKLPQTWSYINKCLDTTESFQIRRLTWAAKKLKETEGNVTGWRLLKLAGLNHPLVRNVYEKYIELIG